MHIQIIPVEANRSWRNSPGEAGASVTTTGCPTTKFSASELPVTEPVPPFGVTLASLNVMVPRGALAIEQDGQRLTSAYFSRPTPLASIVNWRWCPSHEPTSAAGTIGGFSLEVGGEVCGVVGGGFAVPVALAAGHGCRRRLVKTFVGTAA